MNSSDSDGNSDLDVLNISVTPFNDPPVNVVPSGTQTATEDVPFSFVTSVTDIDVGGGQMSVTLTSSNGTLISLSGTSGLVFDVGDGTSDATMTFHGTLPQVNSALNGLARYTPPANYDGTSTMVVKTSDDNGNSGAGSPGSDTDTNASNLFWSGVNNAAGDGGAGTRRPSKRRR